MNINNQNHTINSSFTHDKSILLAHDFLRCLYDCTQQNKGVLTAWDSAWLYTIESIYRFLSNAMRASQEIGTVTLQMPNDICLNLIHTNRFAIMYPVIQTNKYAEFTLIPNGITPTSSEYHEKTSQYFTKCVMEMMFQLSIPSNYVQTTSATGDKLTVESYQFSEPIVSAAVTFVSKLIVDTATIECLFQELQLRYSDDQNLLSRCSKEGLLSQEEILTSIANYSIVLAMTHESSHMNNISSSSTSSPIEFTMVDCLKKLAHIPPNELKTVADTVYKMIPFLMAKLNALRNDGGGNPETSIHAILEVLPFILHGIGFSQEDSAGTLMSIQQFIESGAMNSLLEVAQTSAS